MAVINNYAIPRGPGDASYMTADDLNRELYLKKIARTKPAYAMSGGSSSTEFPMPATPGVAPAPLPSAPDGPGVINPTPYNIQPAPEPPPINGPGGINPIYQLPTTPTLPSNPTAPTVPPRQSVSERVSAILGNANGNAAEGIRGAAEAAAEAQRIQTQQAIDNLKYQQEQMGVARTKANRESDLVYSRAMNPTGKIGQNIRTSGLAGSGWQETSRVGLTNEYQTGLNQNTSDYNQAIKETNIAISQAQQNGDIATLQLLQNYSLQLAQQLYQQARDAVADGQWEKSFALQKAAFDMEQASKTPSGGGTSYSYSGGGGSSGSNAADDEFTMAGLFTEDGTPLTGMAPDDVRLYALNRTILDEAGNPVDYERYTSTTDSFKIPSNWENDPPAGVAFEIERNMTRNTTPEEAAHIVASTIYSNADYLSDNDIDTILAKYGMTQEDVIAILSGSGTMKAASQGIDTSISDNNMAYWKMFGGAK